MTPFYMPRRSPPSSPDRSAGSARRDAVTLVLAAALVVGSVLRVVGLTWGLPFALHPDEFVIVQGGLDLARRNSFAPMYFMRPDHVEIQLSRLAYEAYTALGPHASVDAAYAADPARFLLISRSITAVFGIATIVLAYLIGRRFDRRIGAVAAVLFALTPLLVRDSHYATPDVPLTCLLMVVVLALMHYLANPRLLPLLSACAATAVAIAIKYPAVIATLMIAVVVVLASVSSRRPSRILTHGLAAIAGVLGFLLVVSPTLVTDVGKVRAALAQESQPNRPGADGLGWGRNLVFYADLFLAGAGVLLALAFVAGIVVAVRMRMVQAVPVALGALYWLVLSAFPLHWDRWGIPMFITPLVFASIGLVHAYGWASRWRWRTPAAWVVGSVIVANLLVGAAAYDTTLATPDTRITARAWFREAGLTPANTAYEGYSPLRPSSPQPVFDEFTLVDGRLQPVRPGVTHLVLSSCFNARFTPGPRFAAERAFYDAVPASFTLVRSFRSEPVPDRSGIEPVDVVRSVRLMAAYARGGRAGCDLEVYSTG